MKVPYINVCVCTCLFLLWAVDFHSWRGAYLRNLLHKYTHTDTHSMIYSPSKTQQSYFFAFRKQKNIVLTIQCEALFSL